jgi:hypothetical protein
VSQKVSDVIVAYAELENKIPIANKMVIFFIVKPPMIAYRPLVNLFILPLLFEFARLVPKDN